MDPIFIVPLALAVAWAASRKKKTSSKSTPTEPPVEPEFEEPPIHDDPFDTPLDGPGGEEPWRPGGPDLPKPPYDGPVGPKPFPGPTDGPKSPELGDPSPTEIYPGTTPEDIEEHEHAAYGLFISSNCETVYVGERWLENVFMPQARLLVLGDPDAYHHPTAVIFELLVASASEDGGADTATQACVSAWPEFVYGEYTPVGTFSGWIDDRNGEYWDYYEWFDEAYSELSEALWDINAALWDQPELAAVFDRDWPLDAPFDEDDIDLEPTGT